jgi:glyoxylase-like metal-dependent hydrolase (beta-lactamase superfamily II)
VSGRLIDVKHLGRERVIGCFELDGVLVDPGPTSCLETLLSELGDARPRALLLTHIHLDHAGASGSLVERWPELEVYVHERGARHLVDPAKRNLRVLHGSERVLDGAFEVAYTPGHASHHVSYLHGSTAFVGDTGGVRIRDDGLTIPPTPPPDIDVDAWHASIERIKAWKPERLVITHYGVYDDVDDQLDELGRRLDDRSARAREQSRDEFIAGIGEEVAAGAAPEIRPNYAQAAAPEQMHAGLERFWRKRAESAASAR